MACGISVPRPGIEPGPPAVEAQSPNHWTAREFPDLPSLELTSDPIPFVVLACVYKCEGRIVECILKGRQKKG